MRFKIFKASVKEPIFCSNDREVAERCFKVLHDSFYFVAGNAAPIVEVFPFRFVESN